MYISIELTSSVYIYIYIDRYIYIYLHIPLPTPIMCNILVRYMAVSVHPLDQQLMLSLLFFKVFRQVRISYGLDDINLPKNIKHHFPGLCFIEAR